MKILAINGSPRKQWNTADMLGAAVAMAKQEGAEAEFVHLCDLHYKGCRSCFACKRIGGASFGRCVLRDELSPVLEKILEADVVLFGQPIYFGHISSDMWALLERLWFAGMNYDKTYSSNYPRNVVCGMIFTMNAPNEIAEKMYGALIAHLCSNMSRQVGPTESFLVTNTLQFNDYDKYLSTAFDAQAKRDWHENEYPKQKANMLAWVKRLMAQAAKKSCARESMHV